MSRKVVDPSLLAAVNRAAGRTIEEPVVSFNDAVSDFLSYATMRGLSEHTVVSYAKEIRQLRLFLVDSEIGMDDIRSLTVEHYEDFVRHNLDKGFAHTTINTRLRTAKIFGDFCVRKGLIEHNHAADKQTLRVRKRVGTTFTKAQLKRLLATPDISTFEGLRDLTILIIGGCFQKLDECSTKPKT